MKKIDAPTLTTTDRRSLKLPFVLLLIAITASLAIFHPGNKKPKQGWRPTIYEYDFVPAQEIGYDTTRVIGHLARFSKDTVPVGAFTMEKRKRYKNNQDGRFYGAVVDTAGFTIVGNYGGDITDSMYMESRTDTLYGQLTYTDRTGTITARGMTVHVIITEWHTTKSKYQPKPDTSANLNRISISGTSMGWQLQDYITTYLWTDDLGWIQAPNGFTLTIKTKNQ